MNKFNKISDEDFNIGRDSLVRFLSPIEEETGIPQPSVLILEYATKVQFGENCLEVLATKESCPELIEKPIFASSHHLGEHVKAKARYHKFKNSWQGFFAQVFPNLVYTIRDLPGECSFSIQVEIFRAICRDRNFWFDDPFFRDFCEDPYRCYGIYGEEKCEQIRVFINDFIKDLHLRLREPKIRKRILEVRRAGNRNAKEYRKYIRKLFAARTPINVIRIDLAYGTSVSIEDVIKDLEHFHRNMRHKPILFNKLLGYVDKIEYGLSKFFHIHVILFFTSERQANADVYLAQEIGEYWVTLITNGRGSYRNINANKKRYETLGILGIGEIHADDERAINSLCYIVTYFCKEEQFVRPIASPKTKLLRRGEMPEFIGPKRGRPRNSERNAELSNDISKTKTVSNEYIPHQSPSSIGLKINHWF